MGRWRRRPPPYASDPVGSLTPGKIADLLMLTANPLDTIENSLDLKYTVADGVVYNSDNLQAIWPSQHSDQ